MTGSEHAGIVLQDRDRRLLSEIAVMRVVDRETATLVVGFGVARRANFRLRQLTQAGLLRRFFVGSVAHGRKAMYTLSPKGAELINAKLGGITRPSSRLVVSDAFVAHQAGINEIYVALKYRPIQRADIRLRRWLVFTEP
jgi:hypothetical protein